MSRNRLRHSQSLHWMGVLKWILIVGLLSVLGLVYMLGKNQNLHLAQETYQLREHLEEINARNNELNWELNTMKSPAPLAHRLAQMHSTLVPLDQMNASVVDMGSGTLMRLERMETVPGASAAVNLSTTSPVNLNPLEASAGTPATPPAAAPANP